MEFTGEQLDIMFRARLLGTGRGQVLEPWAWPDAYELDQAGWLERRIEPNGDPSWWLTRKADTALDGARLTRQGTEGREN